MRYGYGKPSKPCDGETFGTHEQLAVAWAQQVAPSGRSNDNRMFFEGRILYSYGHHYAIAHMTEEGPILFNSEDYSVSTAKHRRHAGNAVRWRYDFRVPHPESPKDPRNVEHLVGRITEAYENAKRALHRGTLEERTDAIHSTYAELVNYCDAFSLPVPTIGRCEMCDDTTARWNAYYTPQKVAARERARARRALKVYAGVR